jgi:Protein of unknown function (DUF1631)
MATNPTVSPRLQLSRLVRERFFADASKAMAEIGDAVLLRLTELVDEPTNARDSQLRRDVWTAYKRVRTTWSNNTLKVWRGCLEPNSKAKKAAETANSDGLELVGTEEVENKILASRLVMTVNEKVHSELDDLRVRIKFLENTDDLDGNDLLRPEVLILLLIEQWTVSGLPSNAWSLVNDAVQAKLIVSLKEAYKSGNALLISKGVLPKIDLKDRVRAPVRPPGPPSRVSGAGLGSEGADFSGPNQGDQSGYPQDYAQGYGYPSSPGGLSGGGGPHTGPGAPSAMPRSGGGFFSGRTLGRDGSGPGAMGGPGVQPSGLQGFSHSAPPPFWKQSGGSSNPGHNLAAPDDGGFFGAASPLMRARSRAQGMIGQIKRLFVNHAGGEFQRTAHYVPSPGLVQAISPQVIAAHYAAGGTLYQDYSPAGVARVAESLREKTADIKKKAETKGEKATIEIVALMFQAILAEDRIPPGIRVWFARLQMPVLRVALEDPDFFGTTSHPARMLIDRMGSCVMGFDATGVQVTAMEAEVKRIVQVIEQYPETGKKVYQIVYDEFQKFLSKFLTEKGPTQKVVSVAQQVEQKETLAIQFTIEMRNMLKDMPVRDEIRDFLFKVWAEVLAVSALRKGPKHADTITLKKSASDLVWAASAKPNRLDRAKVIQELPDLLLRLRSGMSLLAMAPSEQEAQVKKISDTLADAFLSKTQAIPQAKIDAMAQRLGNLEDFVSEDGLGDLPLDAESIEMMLGIEASDLEVVANGGTKPTAAMLAWAQDLQVGSWYTLDHNGKVIQVQFAWRSERKHLNLFASTAGKSFLIQGGRLAAYLQAGLLLPQEEEALTIRATRDAMAKLEANPERLLA